MGFIQRAVSIRCAFLKFFKSSVNNCSNIKTFDFLLLTLLFSMKDRVHRVDKQTDFFKNWKHRYKFLALSHSKSYFYLEQHRFLKHNHFFSKHFFSIYLKYRGFSRLLYAIVGCCSLNFIKHHQHLSKNFMNQDNVKEPIVLLNF